jgi:hypothetical protein
MTSEPHGKIRVCYAVNYEKDSDIPPFGAFQPVLGGKLTAVDFDDSMTGYQKLLDFVQAISDDSFTDHSDDASLLLENLRNEREKQEATND